MLSAFKNFGVTFLIAALLFGVIAYFATMFVTNTVNSIMTDEENKLNEIIENNENQTPVSNETDPVNNPTGTNQPNEKVPMGESFNFLVLTTDYRPDLYNDYNPALDTMYSVDWYSVSADKTAGCLSDDYRKTGITSITLVRIDKESRQFTYTYFSPLTRVYTPTGNHTLSEVYTYYGINTLSDHINALTGIKTDYRILLNAYNFDEFSNLCGARTITLNTDIYQSADSYTTDIETTVQRIGEDGNPWTEHIPNTLVLAAGEIEINEANLDILSSLSEKSNSDITAKEAYTAELIKAYMTALAEKSEDELRILLSKLIIKEEEWINIEGITFETEPAGDEGAEPDSPSESTDPEEVIPAESSEQTPDAAGDEPYNPWTDTGGEHFDDNLLASDNTAGEPLTEDAEETEEDIPLWIVEVSEPDNPIIETDYTMNHFANVYEMIGAVTYFENKVVTYPGEYKEATESDSAHFRPDMTAGLEKFLELR